MSESRQRHRGFRRTSKQEHVDTATSQATSTSPTCSWGAHRCSSPHHRIHLHRSRRTSAEKGCQRRQGRARRADHTQQRCTRAVRARCPTLARRGRYRRAGGVRYFFCNVCGRAGCGIVSADSLVGGVPMGTVSSRQVYAIRTFSSFSHRPRWRPCLIPARLHR